MATTNFVMGLAGLAILGALLVEVRGLRKAIVEMSERRRHSDEDVEVHAPSERRTVLPPARRRR